MGYDLYGSGYDEKAHSDYLDVRMEQTKESFDSRDGIRFVTESANAVYEPFPGYYRFNYMMFPAVLDFAVVNGWKPEHEIDFYYDQGGNLVSKDDAANLAAALEKGLPDLLGENVAFEKHGSATPGGVLKKYGGPIAQLGADAPEGAQQLIGGVPAGILKQTNLIEYLSGVGKQKVIGFIAFCREQAPFAIY
jgi:hypothetical protein